MIREAHEVGPVAGDLDPREFEEVLREGVFEHREIEAGTIGDRHTERQRDGASIAERYHIRHILRRLTEGVCRRGEVVGDAAAHVVVHPAGCPGHKEIRVVAERGGIRVIVGWRIGDAEIIHGEIGRRVHTPVTVVAGRQNEVERLHVRAKRGEVDPSPVGLDVVLGIRGRAEIGKVVLDRADDVARGILADDREQEPIGIVTGDAAELLRYKIAIAHRDCRVGCVVHKEAGNESGQGKRDDILLRPCAVVNNCIGTGCAHVCAAVAGVLVEPAGRVCIVDARAGEAAPTGPVGIVLILEKDPLAGKPAGEV